MPGFFSRCFRAGMACAALGLVCSTLVGCASLDQPTGGPEGEADSSTSRAAATRAPEQSEGFRLRSAEEKLGLLAKAMVGDSERRDWGRILDLATEIAGLNPEYVEAHLARAEAYEHFRLYDKAIPVWNRVAELLPGRALPLSRIAACHEAKGRREEALRFHERAVKLETADAAAWEAFAWFSAVVLGDKAKAFDRYTQAFALRGAGPYPAEALYGRAMVLAGLDKRAEALADATAAVQAARKAGDSGLAAKAQALVASLQ